MEIKAAMNGRIWNPPPGETAKVNMLYDNHDQRMQSDHNPQVLGTQVGTIGWILGKDVISYGKGWPQYTLRYRILL